MSPSICEGFIAHVCQADLHFSSLFYKRMIFFEGQFLGNKHLSRVCSSFKYTLHPAYRAKSQSILNMF